VSYQEKPRNEQIRAYMSEIVCDTVNNLAKATGKSKGTVLELLLEESKTFKSAKRIQEKVEEEKIEFLRKEIKL
jgi:predicted transcriptional regulator